MKKTILTFGLFSLMMVLTSFTSTEIGGGTAGQSSSINATPGTPNTGGGGAGAGNAGWPGNATTGGSGIVIIAFIP